MRRKFVLLLLSLAFLIPKLFAEDGLPSKRWPEDQINGALTHCPQLQKIVWQGNPIYEWLTRAFDSSSLGFNVAFDAEPVSNQFTTAESGPLALDSIFFVRVNPKYSDGAQAGQDRTAEEILCNLVFELNNVRRNRDHEVIENLAKCGEMQREAYIYDSAQVEYLVLEQTSAFYNSVWVGFCATNNLKPNPNVWRLPLDKTFAERLARYPKGSWYPWKVYGSHYDQGNSGLGFPVQLRVLSEEEMREETKKAAAGDPHAQERIGVVFLCGEKGAGMANDQQAFDWILKAADQGDILAQEHLEWMYRYGIGVERNQVESFDWISKAANQEDARAEFSLGMHYETGSGVRKDMTAAARWYQKSADQGDGKAQDAFGYDLLVGNGVAKDTERGLGYLTKAAHGNAHASFVLADCYANGFYVKKDLSEAYRWCLISLSMDTQAKELSEAIKKELPSVEAIYQ